MPVCCRICRKIFSRRGNLNRHLFEKHDVENKNIVSYNKNVYNFKCDECNSSFINNNELRLHLHEKHDLNNDLMEDLKFLSYEEFLKWLKQEECDKAIEYFKSATHHKDKFKTIYFNCNRSGKFIEKKVRSKITKKNGSCKLNKYCTSQIVVQNNLITGSILAKYYYIHYGHNPSIQHIRLPKQAKERIAEKLMAGVTPSRILMDERKCVGVENTQVQRTDLLTLKDINNIKIAYKIHVSDDTWHEDDVTDVGLWIDECSENSDSNLIFCKEHGNYLNDQDYNVGETKELIEPIDEQEDTTVELKKQQIKNDATAIIRILEKKSVSIEEIEIISEHVKIAKKMLYMNKNKSSSKFMLLKSIKGVDNEKIDKQINLANINEKENTWESEKQNENLKVIVRGLLHDHAY